MIVNAQTWRKWNSKFQRYDYCYCFGDVHVQHPINETHLNSVMSLITQAGPLDETLVIVEDLTYMPVSNIAVVRNFHENSAIICSGPKSISAMQGLIVCCNQHSIEARNIESRFVQQMIIGLLILRNVCSNLNHLQQTIDMFLGAQDELYANNMHLNDPLIRIFATHRLTIGAVAREIYADKERILAYEDGSILTAYYTNIIQTVISRMELLFGCVSFEKLLENEQTVFDYYMSLSADQQKQFMHRYSIFNAELIDAHALHVLHNAHNKHKTFILMGGAHMANMQTILPQLGYELIASEGPVIATISQSWERDIVKTYYSLDINILQKIVQITQPSLWQRVCRFIEICFKQIV